MILPAHGIGGRADLPLPGEVVLQAGGFVVLVSFLAVGLLWREPRGGDNSAGGAGGDNSAGGQPLPAWTQRLADARRARTAVRAVALAVLLWVLGWAFLGPPAPDANPAPRALYVLAWVGVVPASLLFGPVWRVCNPLRLGADRPGREVRPLPAWLGYWPAAFGLAVFVWVELVPPTRAEPVVVGAFLLGYSLAVAAGGWVYGSAWFERADPFEVYSTLVAALAPFGRRPRDGRLVWRSPLRGLRAVPVRPGLVAVLAVWWGSTVFDGVSGGIWWANLGVRVSRYVPYDAPVSAVVLLSTVVLVTLMILVAVSYRLATGRLAEALVSTLVPIAVGYTVAHYASLLVGEGPRGLAQLLGLPPPEPASPHPLTVAAVQVAAILVGHVLGVVAAHDRTLALAPPGAPDRRSRQLADQVPLVLIMIVYTMVGLYLLVVA